MTRAEERELARVREAVRGLPGDLLWAAADALFDGSFRWEDWLDPAPAPIRRAWKDEVWRLTNRMEESE